MTNATIAFTRLVAARAEGGNAHAIQAAQNLVAENFPGRTFDTETAVNRVFNALDRGDRAGAEAAINDALATLNRPEPEPAVVAEPTPGLEARIAALESIAQERLGVVVNTALPLEGRVDTLENLARRNGLL